MTRQELVSLIASGVALLVAGLTWWLGKYVLIGCGATLLVASLFIDIEDG